MVTGQEAQPSEIHAALRDLLGHAVPRRPIASHPLVSSRLELTRGTRREQYWYVTGDEGGPEWQTRTQGGGGLPCPAATPQGLQRISAREAALRRRYQLDG